MKRIFTLFTLYTLFLSSLYAKDFDLLMQWELGFGGEEIVTSTQGNDMNAGDGITYAIGTIFDTFDNRDDFQTALTIGWTFDWRLVAGDDALLISKFPLTLTEYYTINRWRLGAGLTYHLGHKLYGNNTVEDVKFDNALGGVFSLGYLVNQGKTVQIGLRGTLIEYKVNSYTIDGNRIALFAEAKF